MPKPKNKTQKAKGTVLSLKWKIFAYLLGFCFLLLLILWLFQTVFLESFYTSIKLSQAKKEAAAIAEMLKTADEQQLNAYVLSRGDSILEVVDEEGKTLFASSFFLQTASPFLNESQRRDVWKEAKNAGGLYTMRYDAARQPDFDERPLPGAPPAANNNKPDIIKKDMPQNSFQNENILCALITTLPTGEEAMLLLYTKLSPVSASVETLQTQLIYISVIMLLLAVCIAIIISRRVAKPIAALNSTAAKLGAGDYSVNFSGGSYNEVAELSKTLNAAAAELAKTEILRKDLIANVSHDLRTPLTLITGYAEMMRDIPGENNPENMQTIIDEANRLTALVSDLLDLSRLQSGTAKMQLEVFDLTAETAAIIERFKKLGGANTAEISFEYEKNANVAADRLRISQVIYNFLSNAILHAGRGGKIAVRQKIINKEIIIEVQDYGEGIRTEKLPYVWDKYYKQSTNAQAKGTGLGLSIAKSILEQHGGAQYGVSSKQGQGSTFWFSLPEY